MKMFFLLLKVGEGRGRTYVRRRVITLLHPLDFGPQADEGLFAPEALWSAAAKPRNARYGAKLPLSLRPGKGSGCSPEPPINEAGECRGTGEGACKGRGKRPAARRAAGGAMGHGDRAADSSLATRHGLLRVRLLVRGSARGTAAQESVGRWARQPTGPETRPLTD